MIKGYNFNNNSPLLMKKIHAFRILLSLIIVVVIGLICEFIVYMALCFAVPIVPASFDKDSIDSYTNKPVVRFDRHVGYKWIPGSGRILRIINSEVIFDYVFKINEQGYHSARNYLTKKKPGTHRIIMLGDSFLNQLYEDPWPDYLQNLTSKSGLNLEWYAFSADGGGIVNWHEIFFNEIVPKYEFDTVLIAHYVDNFSREFTIFDIVDGFIGISRFENFPESNLDYAKNFYPKLAKLIRILPDPELDTIASKTRSRRIQIRPWRFYLTRYLIQLASKRQRAAVSRNYGSESTQIEPENAAISVDHRYTKVASSYRPGHMQALENILEYCRKHNKNVILSTVPDRDLLREFMKSHDRINRHQYELQTIAQKFSLNFFDGYKVLASGSHSNADDYYLKYDNHWTGTGSSEYARALLQFVQKQLVPHSGILEQK